MAVSTASGGQAESGVTKVLSGAESEQASGEKALMRGRGGNGPGVRQTERV